MRLLTSLFLSVVVFAGGAAAAVHAPMAAPLPDAWMRILQSINISASAHVQLIAEGQNANGTDWPARVDSGTFLILQGESGVASSFGFRPTGKKITVRGIIDARNPNLDIVWEKTVELSALEAPPQATVFAWERSKGAPVMAGFRKGKGAVLWIATDPGPKGFERYPYIPQALVDLGLEPRVRSNRLWAFFDSSYRTRVDLDYLAERWHDAGIGTLHVAAWHYNEPDNGRDAFLKDLIEACHKRAILVYAWLELPHVSEKFWNDHPEWREKTALQQDAHLDWRKLMNLTNREAFQEAARQTTALINRFDWDGVNLAELYFESLEGQDNPSRFTPFNADVRRDYKSHKGIDPLDLIGSKNTKGMKDFLGYRADLARKMQEEWMEKIETIRHTGKPDLDLVLTHVDDRFDTRMRELIGADAGRLLPLLNTHDFTFLVEDPATIWNLGPDRYPEIARRYLPLTTRQDKLAIDINVVERYQDVYPTKQQTGAELFQLVHTASTAFPRVALYFENSILKPDWQLLPSAVATPDRFDQNGDTINIESRQAIGVAWKGSAQVNGKLWPIQDAHTLWLPSGHHLVQPADEKPGLTITSFNGNVTTAVSLADGIDLTYESSSRAIAVLDRPATRVETDAKPAPGGAVLLLPRGRHRVRFWVP
jgi:hypothetical protein